MSYKELKSYKQATVIYDFTVGFCKRYIDMSDKSNKSYKTYSRMSDQMIQAARSGKQNIVEGSAEKTSEKSELLLLGVARASFAELLEDYEDFLRQQGLRQWGKDDPEALAVRQLVYTRNRSDKTDRSDKIDKIESDRSENRSNRSYKTYLTYETYKSYLDSSEQAANCAICLINQASFLLDQQIKAAEKEFIKSGDYTKRLDQKTKTAWLAKREEEDKWLKEQIKKFNTEEDDEGVK
jgi:restriction system protein